ncbi:hypothetical protein PS2_007802 [Malus domestica]
MLPDTVPPELVVPDEVQSSVSRLLKEQGLRCDASERIQPSLEFDMLSSLFYLLVLINAQPDAKDFKRCSRIMHMSNSNNSISDVDWTRLSTCFYLGHAKIFLIASFGPHHVLISAIQPTIYSVQEQQLSCRQAKHNAYI